MEKGIHTYQFDSTDYDDTAIIDIEYNDILQDGNEPVVFAHYYTDKNGTIIKEYLDDADVSYNVGEHELTISNLNIYKAKMIEDNKNVYIELASNLHTKYRFFHNFDINLRTDDIILLNWQVTPSSPDNLIANFESPHFIYDVQEGEDWAKGKVKQIYAMLDDTHSLRYTLDENLSDPSGWANYKTLIMKLGLLNPYVLDYLNVKFYFVNASGPQLIGTSNVTLEMFDDDTGAVYIPLPDTSEMSKFTTSNNAYIEFTAEFYEADDFEGYFYEQGLPSMQTVIWDREAVKNGNLSVMLEKEPFSTAQKVMVLNNLYEYIYSVNIEPFMQEFSYYDEKDTYELEFYNVVLPQFYNDSKGNLLEVREGEIQYLKYNTTLEKSIGLTVEEMALEMDNYLPNYLIGQPNVPIAEVCLLGINTAHNGYNYTGEVSQLYQNFTELVAWNTALDLTPFEDTYYDTYKQMVFNISFEQINPDFIVSGEDGFDYSYITDVLITCNDPSYELVVDSFFIFEFDYNSTLYDSEIFDLYPLNHYQEFYYNYTDIYSKYVILNCSEHLPLYYYDPYTPSLEGWWNFDDKEESIGIADDISGNNYDGILTNMDENNWVQGKIGSYALTFNGQDEYVDCGSTVGKISMNEDFTISVWVKLNDDADRKPIVDHYRYGLELNESEYMKMWIKDVGGWKTAYSLSPLTPGVWYHIVGMYRGSADKKIVLYINGQLQSTVSTNGLDESYSYSNLFIGKSNHMGGLYYNGVIDDVRYYESCLSEGEIQWLANEYMYHSNVNETLYFEAYDNRNNYYYFGDHLFAVNISQGIYNITWNKWYSEEYYYGAKYAKSMAELQALYEYYQPYISNYSYLYISWADADAWKEWRTLDTPNIKTDTLEVAYEYYNEETEEFTTIYFNQSLGEFEVRQLATEYFYPYNITSQSHIFTLSQNYTQAIGLEIFSVEGYYFDESCINLTAELLSDGMSIEITAPAGKQLFDFQFILIILTFNSGAYSDYTQIRLTEDAKNNHPETECWSINDSLWVDYEYVGFDYFLLFEDYDVGYEESWFEYVPFIRNNRFVNYTGPYRILYLENGSQECDFAAFIEYNDPRQVIEFYDYNMDAEHEVVIEKMDLTNDGIFDSFKYGETNAAGEISFHTLIQSVSYTDQFVRNIEEEKENPKSFELNSINYIYKMNTPLSGGWSELWNDVMEKEYRIYAKKEIKSETTITTQVEKFYYLIQKDVDMDGYPDKEFSYSLSTTSIEAITSTRDKTTIYFKPKPVPFENPKDAGRTSSEEYIKQYFTSVYKDSITDISMLFREFELDEVSGSRLYRDTFPNELTVKYDLNNYLVTIVKDMDDYDSYNDIQLQVPTKQPLLEFCHAQDNVPALFDAVSILANGKIQYENILTSLEKIIVPGTQNEWSQLDTVGIVAEVIKVVPKDGVFYDNNIGFKPLTMKGGAYYYLDGDKDGESFETIVVADADDKVIGIGFDYDYDRYFNPQKRLKIERHITKTKFSEDSGDFNVKQLIYHDLLGYDDDEGTILEKTFSDALFDLWKINMEGGSSQLIQDAEKLTFDKFMEFNTPERFAAECAWQVEAGIISMGAAALSGPFAILVGPAVYTGLMMLKGYIDIKERENILASETFHSEEFKGTKVLSKKWWVDDWFGNNMANSLYGNPYGVYVPVVYETNKYRYEGQVILSLYEGLVGSKTTTSIDWDTENLWDPFEVEYHEGKVDYALTSRNYNGYSDYDDMRLDTYLEKTKGCLGISILGMPYMKESMLFLENAVKQTSEHNNDVPLNSILLHMYDYYPVMNFIDSESIATLPDFYLDYPIYVSDDAKYLEDKKANSQVIWKVWEADSPEIRLIPSGSTHTMQNDIVEIEVHLVSYLDHSSGIRSYKENVVATLDSDDYSFDTSQGVITLNADQYEQLKEDLEERIEEVGSGVEVFMIFEIYVEKYRSIEDNRDLTADEVERIATMQSILASMLEYYYQFQIATETQAMLDELVYTVAITAVSTALTLGIGTACKLPMGSMTGILTEPLEEVFVDPMIDSAASGFVQDYLGWDEYGQMAASCIAESGRESQFGIFSFQASYQQYQLNQKLQQMSPAQREQYIAELESEVKQQQEQSTIRKIAKAALTTFAIFFPISLGFGMGSLLGSVFGQGLGMAYSLYLSRDKAPSVKEAFEVIISKEPEADWLQPDMYIGNPMEGLFPTFDGEIQRYRKEQIFSFYVRTLSSNFFRLSAKQKQENMQSVHSIKITMRMASELIPYFKQLYPDGYHGFKDPRLGLMHYGMERGWDIRELILSGGLEGKRPIATDEEKVMRQTRKEEFIKMAYNIIKEATTEKKFSVSQILKKMEYIETITAKEGQIMGYYIAILELIRHPETFVNVKAFEKAVMGRTGLPSGTVRRQILFVKRTLPEFRTAIKQLAMKQLDKKESWTHLNTLDDFANCLKNDFMQDVEFLEWIELTYGVKFPPDAAPPITWISRYFHGGFAGRLYRLGFDYEQVVKRSGLRYYDKDKASHIGTLNHWNCIYNILRFLRDRVHAPTYYETTTPANSHKPDISIGLIKEKGDESFNKFKKYIFDIQKVIKFSDEMKRNIKVINIDFYHGQEDLRIEDKCWKGYQGSSKLLIIVLMGTEKQGELFRKDLLRKVPPHSEHVYILNREEFARFIGLEGTYYENFIETSDWAREAVWQSSTSDAYINLKESSKISEDELENILPGKYKEDLSKDGWQKYLEKYKSLEKILEEKAPLRPNINNYIGKE